MSKQVYGIIRSVSDHFDVPRGELLGTRRTKSVAVARQALMWAIRQKTFLSLEEIGSYLNRDHSTVLHGIRRTQERIDEGKLDLSGLLA